MSLAGEAKALLNNPVFVEALDAVRTQAINGALSAGPRDDDLRRKYLDAAKTVDGVKSHLAAVIQAQEVADEAEKLKNIENFYSDRAKARWNAASQGAMMTGAA